MGSEKIDFDQIFLEINSISKVVDSWVPHNNNFKSRQHIATDQFKSSNSNFIGRPSRLGIGAKITNDKLQTDSIFESRKLLTRLTDAKSKTINNIQKRKIPDESCDDESKFKSPIKGRVNEYDTLVVSQRQTVKNLIRPLIKMKFEEHLDEEMVPEWRLKYVNYKQLKSLLSKIPIPEDSPLYLKPSLAGSAPHEFNKKPLGPEEIAFFDRIIKEIQLVDEFFAARMGEALNRKHQICKQLEILHPTSETQGLESANQMTVKSIDSNTHAPITGKVDHVKIRTLRGTSFTKLARSRIKKALLEYYRSLELLRNYKNLNFQAFVKILKKFDKITNRNLSGEWMAKIKSAGFMKGDSLDELLTDVERLYRWVFTQGDRGKAIKKLRVLDFKQETFYTSAIVSGILLGVGSMQIGKIASFMKKVETGPAWTLFYIYWSFFLPIFMALLFAVNGAVWERYHINYRFIFEYNQRNMLHGTQYTMFIGFIIVAYLSFVQLSLSGWFDSIIRPFLQPWIALGGLSLILLLPLPLFYHKTRLWFAKVNMRILVAPFYPVRFKDFFLNDQFMSLTEFFLNIGWLIHLTLEGDESKSTYYVSQPFRWYYVAIRLFPAYGRIMQCSRRYNDTGMWFPHLANLAKYFCSFIVPFTNFINNEHASLKLVLTIILTTVSSLYSLTWDVIMDFGLLQKDAVSLWLRPSILFPAFTYYLLVVFDLAARFLWISKYVVPKHLVGDSGVVPGIFLSMVLATVEVVRRIIWNFYRVEYEQVNNSNVLKAINDIALPYRTTGDLFYQDMTKEPIMHESSMDNESPTDQMQQIDDEEDEESEQELHIDSTKASSDIQFSTTNLIDNRSGSPV